MPIRASTSKIAYFQLNYPAKFFFCLSYRVAIYKRNILSAKITTTLSESLVHVILSKTSKIAEFVSKPHTPFLTHVTNPMVFRPGV